MKSKTYHYTTLNKQVFNRDFLKFVWVALLAQLNELEVVKLMSPGQNTTQINSIWLHTQCNSKQSYHVCANLIEIFCSNPHGEKFAVISIINVLFKN